LRYFNVFGPRQDPHSIYSAVIPRFITALRKGDSPVINGDGRQSWDFTCVENVVQANLLAVAKPGIPGQVFNIACGRPTNVNELVFRLRKFLERAFLPVTRNPGKEKSATRWQISDWRKPGWDMRRK